MRTILFSLGIAAACLAANPALAGEVKLAWKDLDLTTAAGKAELDSRIDAAAEQACTSDPATGSRLTRATPGCIADARHAIIAQIAPRLGGSRFAATSGGAKGEARR